MIISHSVERNTKHSDSQCTMQRRHCACSVMLCCELQIQIDCRLILLRSIEAEPVSMSPKRELRCSFTHCASWAAAAAGLIGVHTCLVMMGLLGSPNDLKPAISRRFVARLVHTCTRIVLHNKRRLPGSSHADGLWLVVWVLEPTRCSCPSLGGASQPMDAPWL